jgi:hypothetical protein
MIGTAIASQSPFPTGKNGARQIRVASPNTSVHDSDRYTGAARHLVGFRNIKRAQMPLFITNLVRCGRCYLCTHE